MAREAITAGRESSSAPAPASVTGVRTLCALASAGPLLVSDGHGGLTSRAPAPGRRIALTFDDGPSPQWTPRILSILERDHIPGTFFEIGANAARHPAITRRVVRDGFELGNHTFTHPDLATLPAWQRDLQLSMTESAFAGSSRFEGENQAQK